MKNTEKIILVTGPASSGKSEWAEYLATQSNKKVVYVATAYQDENDPEWVAKIKQHAQRRSPQWITREVPIQLVQVIRGGEAEECLLIDSLGPWVANLLDRSSEEWESTVNELLEATEQTLSTIIWVGEETTWGIVPAYASGRVFRDRLGNLIRRIGEKASKVYLITGGYALDLTQLGISLKTI